MNLVSATRDRVLLATGALAIAGNVLGVVFLADVPSAYRPQQLDRWAAEVALHPLATSASAIAFTVGLLALAIWALVVCDRLGSRSSCAGARAIALGASLNAAGTVTPLVLALHVGELGPPALGRALLGITLSLDACFNLTLGAGLIAIAFGLPAETPRWLRLLAVIAGIASLPVSAQVFSDGAAKLLAVSAPLWLACILAVSAVRWRDHVAGA